MRNNLNGETTGGIAEHDTYPNANRTDKRREGRLRSGKPVWVSVLCGQRCTTKGVALDISRSGLGLLLNSPIPPKSIVRVDYPGWLILGEVSYCIETGDDYRTGILLERVIRGGALRTRFYSWLWDRRQV